VITMVDPVCGVLVDGQLAPYTVNFLEMCYCFCSRECQEEFLTHPERYLPQDAEQTVEVEGLA
jgi:YHS domain-containing protein